MRRVIQITKDPIGFRISFIGGVAMYIPADPRSWDDARPPRLNGIDWGSTDVDCFANIWPFVRDNSPLEDLRIKKWLVLNIVEAIRGDPSNKIGKF